MEVITAIERPSTFQQSLPITLTSFINKVGTIGLSIIPIILVERRISIEHSSWIMGGIKSAGFLGIWIGGWCCDSWGFRRTLLLSFLISGVGMLGLPFVGSAFLIGALGALAQLGSSFYFAPARLLLTQMVEPHQRREAFAWQRTANNFAQIISFSLGALLGKFGTGFLVLFDALTSFSAIGVGRKVLPREDRASPIDVISPRFIRTRFSFFQCVLIIATFSFLYEIYLVSAAAKCKLLFGDQGLTVYSQMMIINTVLCAAFSVTTSRILTNAVRVLPIGLTLLSLGMTLTFGSGQDKFYFFLGSLVLTLGELVFNSLAGLVLIQVTPPGKKQASLYSSGLLVQFVGRILGASLAFPLVVDSHHPTQVIGIACAIGLALCMLARGTLKEVSDARRGSGKGP